jgi:hypothetical protein
MGYWDKVLSKIRKQDVTPVADATPALIAPEKPKQPTWPYRTDAPINDPRLDVFDREPFARRIADTIGERNDPSSLVVGIYGPWVMAKPLFSTSFAAD